jgi:hypothetical protein
MTDPAETARLVDQIARGYREHAAEEAGPAVTAVPGTVVGADIEGQADALADDAARLTAEQARARDAHEHLAEATAAHAAELDRIREGNGPASARCDRGVPRPEPRVRVNRRRGGRAAPPGMARPRGRRRGGGHHRMGRRAGGPEVRGEHLRVGC